MAEDTPQKSDRSVLIVIVLGLLAGASFLFLAYQYQNYKKLAKGVEIGLTQLPKIYELDRLIKEKQIEQPNSTDGNADEIPAPSALINFFSAQIFTDLSLEQLKSQCIFDIMPSSKISETENEENISIQFKRVSRLDLANYVFHVEKKHSFIKLKEVEFKSPPKQDDDVWEAKLIFAYRRLKK